MSDQVEVWKQVAAALEVDIVAPFEVTLKDGRRVRATALVRNFGAREGMVVDPDWLVLKPYADALIAGGYGYSAIEVGEAFDRADMIVVLSDWGWSGTSPAPLWLVNQIDDQDQGVK